MRFSVTLGAAGPGRDPRSLAGLAALAEECRWDTVFLEDYVVYQGRSDLPTYDPWVCMAAMAMATDRIRLGTTVTPVPRRRPWKLASEAVSLDHLSGGRVILGVGIGDNGDPCLGRVGEPDGARVRAGQLDEALTIIDRLWTGETVTHHGPHYRLDRLRLAAVPLQQPRIPIWVGGDLLVPSVRRRIARWDGSCAYKAPPGVDRGLVTPDEVRGLVRLAEQARGNEQVERARQARGEHAPGRGMRFDVKVSGSSDPATLAAWDAAGATWWGRFIEVRDLNSTRAIIQRGPPHVVRGFAS